MKIVDVITHVLRQEATREEAFACLQEWHRVRTAMIVEAVTDDGVVGLGEAYGPAATPTIPSRLMVPDPLVELDRTPNVFRDQLAEEPLDRRGDRIRIPDRPGISVTLNREVLERYEVTR